MLKIISYKIKPPTKYLSLFSIVLLQLPLPCYLSKTAFFHSTSPSEPVFVSYFGEGMLRDQKPDLGKGHRRLPGWGRAEALESSLLKLNSKCLETRVALPNICRYIPFQPQNSHVPTAGYTLMPRPASVIQPIGCQIAPLTPGACTRRAEDCFCRGATGRSYFYIPSTTYNNVENKYLKLQRSMQSCA